MDRPCKSVNKKILLIATGGTIASRPTTAGALAPAISAAELLQFVPELADICQIDSLELFNLDSTDMGPEQWVEMVRVLQKKYDLYDGFVITHGTDTMAYTAAAMSYLVQNSKKPIVLTGSQKSIYNRDTDARNNLLRAFAYAADDEAWGVQIVFDNKVILGTRARKVRSKSFNAFSSINYPEIAMFRDMQIIHFIPGPENGHPVQFFTKIDPAVFTLRLVPGMTADIFPSLQKWYHGIVIEGFGVGGLPGGENGEMLKCVKEWLANGMLVVFSTQVQHEGSDLSVYEVGRIARELPGVMESHDMTPEAVTTKLMWAFGQTNDPALAKELFLQPVQKDRVVLF